MKCYMLLRINNDIAPWELLTDNQYHSIKNAIMMIDLYLPQHMYRTVGANEQRSALSATRWFTHNIKRNGLIDCENRLALLNMNRTFDIYLDTDDHATVTLKACPDATYSKYAIEVAMSCFPAEYPDQSSIRIVNGRIMMRLDEAIRILNTDIIIPNQVQTIHVTSRYNTITRRNIIIQKQHGYKSAICIPIYRRIGSAYEKF